MVFLNSSISIFTLNINGPNSPLRVSFRVHEDLRSYLTYLEIRHLKWEDWIKIFSTFYFVFGGELDYIIIGHLQVQE